MIWSGFIVALTVAGALLAVVQQNIVRAIFGLAIALLGVALAFLELGSPFVAAMQVLVYIGGITVAMVFAVMLSSAGQREPRIYVARRVIAGIVALAFFAGVAIVIVRSDLANEPDVEGKLGSALSLGPWPSEFWSVEAIGRELLDRFNVVFELLSVVLLVAILGAITIATKDEDGDDGSDDARAETTAVPGAIARDEASEEVAA